MAKSREDEDKRWSMKRVKWRENIRFCRFFSFFAGCFSLYKIYRTLSVWWEKKIRSATTTHSIAKTRLCRRRFGGSSNTTSREETEKLLRRHQSQCDRRQLTIELFVVFFSLLTFFFPPLWKYRKIAPKKGENVFRNGFAFIKRVFGNFFHFFPTLQSFHSDSDSLCLWMRVNIIKKDSAGMLSEGWNVVRRLDNSILKRALLTELIRADRQTLNSKEEVGEYLQKLFV